MTVPALTDYCWPIDPACLPDSWDGLSDSIKDRAVALATGSLRRLTAERVGGCPITIRPCRREALRGLPLDIGTVGGWSGAPFYPYLDRDGDVRNYGPCGCGCGASCSLDLGQFCGRLDSIKIDGQAQTLAGNWRIDDGHYLVWQGGGDCPLPTDNDMNLPDSEVGTWSVSYLPAHPVDGAGAWAAALLAAEFAKACGAPGTCKLPKNVQSITRQGVSMQLVTGVFPNGLTNIPEVDAWVALWNPNGLSVAPQVWSPDTISHRSSTYFPPVSSASGYGSGSYGLNDYSPEGN